MFETIYPVYNKEGELINPGNLIQLTDAEAESLLRQGYVKRAVFTVPIEVPEAELIAKVEAETAAKIKEETAIALQKAAKDATAAKVEAQAKLEREKAATSKTAKTDTP